MPGTDRRWLAYAALLGAVVCWSSVPLFLKHFTTQLDAWTVNGVRYGFAAVLMTPALFASRAAPPRGRRIWLDALTPAFVNTLGQVGWALAPYFVDASVMGFGIRSSFFFTLLAGLWLLPEERRLLRSPAFWAGTGLCVLGLVALFAGTLRPGSATAPGGSLIVLGTAVVWGFYGVSVRKFMRGYAVQNSFAVICLYTAAALVGLMLLFGQTGRLRAMSPPAVSVVLLSAVAGIATAHLLMYVAIERLGPVIESGGEFLSPFLTCAGAALLFGERLDATQWMGGLGVVAGSILMLRARRGQDQPIESSPTAPPSNCSSFSP